MKGLIKKDLLLLKHNAKSVLIVLLLFVIFNLKTEGAESFIIAFLAAMLCISTFSYDEFNKWDAYAITMSTKRQNIVKAKYITELILLVTAFSITLIFFCAMGAFKGALHFESTLTYALAGLASAQLTIAVIFPFIFKYGLEKGRILIFTMTVGFSLLVGALSTFIKLPSNILEILDNTLYILLPLGAIVGTVVSYIVSKNIYAKKEF